MCDDGWEGSDCSSSIGVKTLVYGLVIGGGTLGGLLVLGTLVWFSRLLSSGIIQTPSLALQQSRLKHAHAISVEVSSNVHIPNRHIPSRHLGGYRSRITPNA